MRPAGEVRMALLGACAALATAEQGATLRELAAHACVGMDAARRTVSDMRRAGVVCVLRERRVTYRNRPVAEYVPAGLLPVGEPAALAGVFTAWAG